MSAARTPLTLEYDELPPGSDIRREFAGGRGAAGGVGGTAGVTITVPAGDPPPAVIRQTRRDAFASGAASSWALLLLALLVFLVGAYNNRLGGIYLAWAWAFFALFCCALVLLVVWVRYGVMLDAIRAGREQMTVLAATPTRLLIETTGPFGVASYDFPRDKIAKLTLRRGVLRDDRNMPRRVLHLALALSDGRTICFLPGRDERELTWVAATVQKILGLSTSAQ